jgi:hypothetical protein
MSKCNDHWCEHYGKKQGNCDQCTKKESEKNHLDARVVLQRRQVKQMDLDKPKNKGQKR